MLQVNRFAHGRSLVLSAIAGATGTAIGNMSSFGGLAAGFDGTTNKTQGASAGSAGSSGRTLGKDWGSGTRRTIGRYLIYAPSNGVGFVDGAGNITCQLQRSDDNFSSDITTLHSDTFAAAAGQVRDYTSGIIGSPGRYHRVVMATSGSTTNIYIAQLVFYELK